MIEIGTILKTVRTRKLASGLIVAYSDELPGLLVTGRTEREVSERLPRAIREILKAQNP